MKDPECARFLQVRREWILLDGAVAAFVVNRTTKRELIEHATAYFSAGLPPADLVDLLLVGQKPYNFTPDEFAQLRETT